MVVGVGFLYCNRHVCLPSLLVVGCVCFVRILAPFFLDKMMCSSPACQRKKIVVWVRARHHCLKVGERWWDLETVYVYFVVGNGCTLVHFTYYQHVERAKVRPPVS